MKKKLKVIIVVTAPYVVRYHLPNILKRLPNDFEVCVVGQGVLEFQDQFPNIQWIDCNIERKIHFISDLLALLFLCRLFTLHRPDILHSLMPKAGLLASIAGFICRVPTRIHTFTGQVWATKSGFTRIIFRAADQLINLLNSVCLTDSPSQSEFLLKNKITHLGRALPVLSKGSLSGVDISRFNLDGVAEQANQLRIKLKIDKEKFVFSYIARKTIDKGAIDMLKAFSSVSVASKNVVLLFIGPDEDGEVERLRDMNPVMFENVIEFGHVSNHEVYLAITDVLCLPSHREGFGSIVIDAAAMGVPTIGSCIPGLTDSVIDKKTGLLFPAGNLDEMVKLMFSVIENPDWLQILGDCAKARVDEFFTADQLYSALKELYSGGEASNRILSH